MQQAWYIEILLPYVGLPPSSSLLDKLLQYSSTQVVWRNRSLSLKVPPTHRHTGRATRSPAIQISDALGKRRPLGRCGGGSVESDTCEL